MHSSTNHYHHAHSKYSNDGADIISASANDGNKSPNEGYKSQHSNINMEKQATKIGCVNLSFKLGGGNSSSSGGGGGGGGNVASSSGTSGICAGGSSLSYDDSIDDSDGGGSVVTTMTTSTYADNQSGRSRVARKANAFRKGQSFHYTKNTSGTQTHPHHMRRIASGLRLAQSQAMAVAGFLPEYIEMQSTDSGECRERDYSDFDDRTTSTMLSKSCERNIGSAGSSSCGPGHLSTRASFHGRGLSLFCTVIFSLVLY